MKKSAPNLHHLALYRKDCKRCGHLDPDEPKKFTACHYSRGNDQCPALEIQFVVVGKAKKWAAQVQAARDKRDPDAEARILKLVAKQSEAFKSKFYSILESSGELE